MMRGTINVGRRLNGKRRSAAMDAESARANLVAVLTTKRISARPSVFHT
jgi:hypothetical protein